MAVNLSDIPVNHALAVQNQRSAVETAYRRLAESIAALLKKSGAVE
jgi:hypothetical protein